VIVEVAAGMCLGSRVGVGCACWFELVVLGGVWVMVCHRVRCGLRWRVCCRGGCVWGTPVVGSVA
jgi:hypothetical protein